MRRRSTLASGTAIFAERERAGERRSERGVESVQIDRESDSLTVDGHHRHATGSPAPDSRRARRV
jgi:hypothetical protein